MNTIQFEDLARQRLQQSAETARTHSQRHPRPEAATQMSRRLNRWRVRWTRPAHARVVGP